MKGDGLAASRGHQAESVFAAAYTENNISLYAAERVEFPIFAQQREPALKNVSGVVRGWQVGYLQFAVVFRRVYMCFRLWYSRC